jgi:hypothetical protein
MILVTDGMLDLVAGEEDDQVECLMEALRPLGSKIPTQKLEEALFQGENESNRSDDRCLVTVDIK